MNAERARTGRMNSRIIGLESRMEKIDKERAEEQEEWEEKERGLQNQVALLQQEVERQSTHLGRTAVSRMAPDNYDRANRGPIVSFCRYEILPHYKFWSKAWKMATGKDHPRSFNNKIDGVLTYPPGCRKPRYFEKRIVPMVNKYLIEWRSNRVSETKEIVLGNVIALKDHLNLFLVRTKFTLTCHVPSVELKSGEVNVEERQEMMTNLPKLEEFLMDGKMFVEVIKFVIKFCVPMYGKDVMKRQISNHPGSSPLDFITASDIAYKLAIIRDKLKVWKQLRELLDMSLEERAATENAKDFSQEIPKFTGRKGVKYETHGCGWSEEGIKFYEKTLKSWRMRMRQKGWYEALKTSWEDYQGDDELMKIWKKVGNEEKDIKQNNVS